MKPITFSRSSTAGPEVGPASIGGEAETRNTPSFFCAPRETGRAKSPSAPADFKSSAPIETEPPLVTGDFGARTALFLAACAGAALVLAGALVWNLVSH